MIETFGSMVELFKYAERRTQSATLIGMVKPCPGDETHFMFSPANCESWFEIPSNGVDGLEYFGQMACEKKGEESHSHPLIRLRLTKQCVTDLPYLRTLSEVLRQRQLPMRRFTNTPASRGAAVSTMFSANRRVALQSMPCFLVNDGGSIVVCCCDDNGDNCECGGIA
jgi:hypothetical protein